MGSRTSSNSRLIELFALTFQTGFNQFQTGRGGQIRLCSIAGVVQQLLQMQLLVLLKLYYEVMKTLVALGLIILHMLYTVVNVNVKLLWSFLTHQSEVLTAFSNPAISR